MKRFIVAVLALTLMFTEVLSPVQVNAVEKANQCEEKVFTVEPFIVGDEKLEGEGHPGEEIDLQFKDIETTIEVDEKGRFEHLWEKGNPEVGDIITLTSTPYEIELTVEAEMSEREELEAELVDMCEPAVPSEEVEGVEVEDSVEEEVTEEASGESGEADEKEAPEGSIEEPSLEEESDPKEGSEETPEAESTEEAGLTEELVVEASDETVPEEDGPAEEAVSSEEPVEEKEEEMESVEAAPKEEEPEVEGKEDVKSEGDTDKETDIAKEEVANKHERTEEADSIEEASEKESEEETKEILREESVEPENGMARSSMAAMQKISIESEVPITPTTSPVRVNTAKDFNNALSSKEVEVIILERDIFTDKPSTVQSNTGQKFIEGNGHSIDLGDATLKLSHSRLLSNDTDITEMVIRNAKLSTTNNSSNDGFFKKERKRMNLMLENVEFNDRDSPGGMLGSSWESTVHFYGSNTIETRSENYGMSFRKIIVHEGAELCFNHEGSGEALNFRKASGENDYGIEIKKDSHVEFEGESNQLIGMNTPITINIASPKLLDFNNRQSDGQIFPFGKFFTNSSRVEFVVSKGEQKVNLSGWHKGDTSKETPNKTPSINSAKFNFDSWLGVGIIGSRTSVVDIDPVVPNFKDMFPPTMRRMVFKRFVVEKLEFTAPPKDMVFETTEIKDEEKVIRRVPEEYSIEVIDTRKNGYWKLTAEVISPLKNKNEDTLPNAFCYFKDGYEPKMIEGKVAFEVASKNMDDNNPTQKVSWDRDEGILIKLNPIRAAADTEYKATIKWTLSDGPK